MAGWIMNFFSKIFGNNSKIDTETNNDGNWIGPDGVESGPNVPDDWYLSYDGPAPIVEDIYEENYAVDRGDGAIPIDFYINKWGIPNGFGKTDYEIEIKRSLTE